MKIIREVISAFLEYANLILGLIVITVIIAAVIYGLYNFMLYT